MNEISVDVENRILHGNQVRDPEEQDDPKYHCQEHPDVAGFGLIRRVQFVGCDRDKNDVVDTQYYFQECKGNQAYPHLWIGKIG
jgi:hypothetical protein